MKIVLISFSKIALIPTKKLGERNDYNSTYTAEQPANGSPPFPHFGNILRIIKCRKYFVNKFPTVTLKGYPKTELTRNTTNI